MRYTRAREDTDGRPRCCASGVCHLCPIDAKFTIENGLGYIYEDPRVTLTLEATVQTVETTGALATGVTFEHRAQTHTANADLVVLGANALFNTHILQRSGVESPALGRRLNEQVSVIVDIKLAGVDNFQGSTSLTGHGYMFYDGPHRAARAGCLLETWNVIPQRLRPERGRWREKMRVKLIFEDLPDEANTVTPSDEAPDLPSTTYHGYSDYTQRGVNTVPDLLAELGQALPIESYSTAIRTTEAHIQGTTAMGDDPRSSVVDKHLLHHTLRNLVVLGSGSFPTCPPANPTLTLSALSLWSAAHLYT